MNPSQTTEKSGAVIGRAVRLERVDSAEMNPTAALVAWLMDTAFIIPGTKVRFGLDALIGLFPGVGDAIGAIVSSLIITQGARLGVPRIVLARMAGNVFINSAVGTIPIAGDLFSVYFRSNVRNYELLKTHAGRRRSSTRGDWLFVIGLVAALLGALALIVFGIVALFRSRS